MIIASYTVAEMYNHEHFHELVAEYADECAIDGMPAPEYKMESYLQLEKVGALKTFAAFNNERLIGFIVLVSPVIPHYGMLVTVIESVFVGKAFRKTGAGLRLIRAAEMHAKEIRSPGLLANAPYGGEAGNVLPSMGYTPVSCSYFKKF